MLLERAGSAPASGCDGLDPAQHPGGSRMSTDCWAGQTHSVWEKFVLSHRTGWNPLRNHLWNGKTQIEVHPCGGGPSHCRRTVRQISKHSLLVFDGVVAGIAHADLELEAHDGVAGALAAALPADSLPALPAVMLRQDRREEKEDFNFCCNAPGFPSETGNGSGEHLPWVIITPIHCNNTQKVDSFNICQGFPNNPTLWVKCCFLFTHVILPALMSTKLLKPTSG